MKTLTLPMDCLPVTLYVYVEAELPQFPPDYFLRWYEYFTGVIPDRDQLARAVDTRFAHRFTLRFEGLESEAHKAFRLAYARETARSLGHTISLKPALDLAHQIQVERVLRLCVVGKFPVINLAMRRTLRKLGNGGITVNDLRGYFGYPPVAERRGRRS